jgi:betaine-aldehyde dehydrogenase
VAGAEDVDRAVAGAEDVDRAVAAARAGFAEWRRVAPLERARVRNGSG